MSTLPGVASKGEKAKQKFQSLDINSLYRVSRGENLEKQQQKSTLVYKHGMQSLGKVPSTRRAPANLPSLKSEHSGTDASVPLVPPGGPGWGKQDTPPTTTSTTTPTTPPTATPSSTANGQPAQPPQLTSHQAAIALPVTTTIPPPNKHPTPSATPATTDKSWSAVMSGPDPSHPPLYQSPQFQHEFPSLSVGDGGPTRTGSDAPYTPGLSLRPQTEGSWIQGGSRPGAEGPPRSSSAPLGAPPQLAAQVGLPQQPLPPQFRSVMPTFMYKGSFPAGNNVAPNQNPSPLNGGGPGGGGGRQRPDNRPPPRLMETEEIVPRPIIKEEELSRMDEIDKDMGWTSHDDIDYNQKLAFSDDESGGAADKGITRKEPKITQSHKDQQQDFKGDNHSNESQRNWGSASINRQRSSDDELWKQRRNQHNKNLEATVQRAKQRKEEEEKRFNEATKQGAAKKLMELEEKMSKRNRDEEGVGTINPLVVPPKPIIPADIPLPDFQREKERDRDSRSRTPNDSTDHDKSSSSSNRESSFRQLTQIEGKNFGAVRGGNNKHPPKGGAEQRDRDPRDQNGPSFSRQFQSQLPPRFQRQRNSSSTSQAASQVHYQFDNRFAAGGQGPNKGGRPETPDREVEADDRRDYKRQSSDDSHRGSHKSETNRFSEEGGHDYNNRHPEYEYGSRRDDKWAKDKDIKKYEHSSGDDWHQEKRDCKLRDERDKHDRPQRPDSRDSRASRESRHSRDSARDSEPREHIGSWAEPVFEPPYEEKRRDHGGREDRRVVPGPITKDRIEADDFKSEKRSLTQLKRGQLPDKNVSDRKDDDKKDDSLGGKGGWADAVSPSTVDPENPKFMDVFEKPLKSSESSKDDSKRFETDSRRSDSDFKERDDKRGGRGRNYAPPSSKWGGGGEYHRSGYSAKRPTSRTLKPYTDSEGSDELVGDGLNKDGHQKSLKSTTKKSEKEDKNKEIARHDKSGGPKSGDKIEGSKRDGYVPRGEPSRHGRGGGNFRSRGGLSKRIDGYGPPPSKSPFGHHDDSSKKLTEENSTEIHSADDKAKLNQQALSAGIIGAARSKDSLFQSDRNKEDKTKCGRKPDNGSRRGKPRQKEQDGDSNSDNSDDKGRKLLGKPGGVASRGPSGSLRRTNNAPPRLASGDKKPYGSSRNDNPISRQNSSATLRSQVGGGVMAKKDDKSDQNTLCTAIADISLKDQLEDETSGDGDDKPFHADSDGFQQVKSKKTGKERVKPLEEKAPGKPIPKLDKDLIKSDRDRSSKPKSVTCSTSAAQLTQQQISNIPPLMATPINPPSGMTSANKNQFERPRQSKLAPRFAKQRLQKAQMQQQQQGICDVNDMNKVNQNLNVYGMKDGGSAVTPITNAWDKSLGSQLRSIDSDNVLGVGGDTCKPLEHAQSTSQSNSPNSDKIIGKGGQLQDKAILDGATAPVNTIIFENTNFKSAPGPRNARSDKPRSKVDDGMDGSVVTGFAKPIGDLLGKSDKQSESLQLPLSFKEDTADIKLDFFESELSHLTEEKSSKNLCMPRSMHPITTANNNSTISSADALNFKIQSVKKMWETPSDHGVGPDDSGSTFSSSFVTDPNTLDPNAFVKGNDNTPDDNHEGYSPSPSQVASNSTTNVCKVKPTQQVSGAGGQAVLSSTSHQQHSGIMGPSLMGNPLSPPPLQTVIGTGVNLGQPPQQYTANQHLNYQAGLGGSNQYGISAIPSPPTVMYNSTQQLQAQSGLYGPFQIDQSGVLSGQGRSQYSQYQNHYGMGQTASSPYSTQSVYLQTQPHPPPSAQAPPDIYQNMNNYRLSATGPFGQNQQLNNPTTVLISSTSNSLMSASVKPSSQQISAIGTKAGGVGQAYQQQSQQSQQLYMAYEPAIQANYMPNAGVMQRGPTGPVQNNIVPALQSSSSYYSGSTGQTGYFQQPGSSSLQSAQLQQHQAGYGLQGNVFGTHNQSHTNAGLQSFNSHFLSNPIQLAAALNAQQYRSGLPTHNQYMKGVGSQQIGDQSGRSQQLKSPGSQEVLSSVFNSGSQISSPKLRQNCKQPQPQPSPTAQHKYNHYQSVGNQQSGSMQRYPTPIQRPVNFQQNMGSSQNNSNQKHRPNNNLNKAPSRQYYQSNSLSSQNEKVEDVKLSDSSVTSSNVNSSVGGNKAVIGTSPAPPVVNSPSEIVKDVISIEETSALKD